MFSNIFAPIRLVGLMSVYVTPGLWLVNLAVLVYLPLTQLSAKGKPRHPGALTYESDVPVPAGFQKKGAIGDKFVVNRGSFSVDDTKMGAFCVHGAKKWDNFVPERSI